MLMDAGYGATEMDKDSPLTPLFASKFKGRGQGLSAASGAVQVFSADITEESSQDQGNSASQVQEIGTVLLVDDDNLFLEITSVMLSRLGFTVLTAIDGVEAVETFHRHKDEIRLVLVDVCMPRMNGWETLLALRQIIPGIPVILCSGYSEERVMKEVHLELPQAFLGKPFGLQALRDTIRRTLRESEE
jgi:CheY-like chemotaxis protein